MPGPPGPGWSRSPGSGPCRPVWGSPAVVTAAGRRYGPSDRPAVRPGTPPPRARPGCSGQSPRPPRPCEHPCSRGHEPSRPAGRPGRTRGYTGHQNGEKMPRQPNGAAWPGSPVPGAQPCRWPAPARRYSPTSSRSSSTSAANLLAPFAMCTPLACSDYYGASAPPRAFGRRRAYPARPGGSRAAGTARGGSHVPCVPIGQVGAQLDPGSLAAPTPQTFSAASWPADLTGFGVGRPG